MSGVKAYHAQVRKLAETKGITIPAARQLYREQKEVPTVPETLAAIRPADIFSLAEANVARLKQANADLQNQIDANLVEQKTWERVTAAGK